VVTETYGMLHALAKKNLMKPRLLAGISSAIGIIICGTNFSENRRFGENALKLQTIIIGSIRCHIHACYRMARNFSRTKNFAVFRGSVTNFENFILENFTPKILLITRTAHTQCVVLIVSFSHSYGCTDKQTDAGNIKAILGPARHALVKGTPP